MKNNYQTPNTPMNGTAERQAEHENNIEMLDAESDI
jgi:hypothetical protein